MNRTNLGLVVSIFQAMLDDVAKFIIIVSSHPHAPFLPSHGNSSCPGQYLSSSSHSQECPTNLIFAKFCMVV